jgi:23S rRNA (uracil1939-C5)-methyltransferase
VAARARSTPGIGVSSTRKPRRGDELEVSVERLDERGHGCGTAQHESGEYRMRVRHALPGERVRARVLGRRGARLEALELETLTASPSRVAPRCAHFGVCGGCSFQDLAYAAQLEEKRAGVERTLRAAGVEVALAFVEPCDEPWRYRNKMDFTFGTRRWIEASEPPNAPNGFALGLHPRDQFRKVLDVEACPIEFERGDAILRDARRLAKERGLSAWDLQLHEGLLRHLVLRESRASREILVQVTTSVEAPELVRPYAEALLAAHPEITTLVQSIHARGATIATGEREVVLHGSGTIRERLAGLEFTISASSFFQTNTAQAEKLVAAVVEEAACGASEHLLDLYCGAGTLSLPLARRCGSVLGVESVAAAVLDAQRNAHANGISNATFLAADVAEWSRTALEREPTRIVVDPPRAGLHPKVALWLAQRPAQRIAYVSCNAVAAARDLALLAPAGWRAVHVRAFDLFPHTPHVECVLTLERRA